MFVVVVIAHGAIVAHSQLVDVRASSRCDHVVHEQKSACGGVVDVVGFSVRNSRKWN